jgi:hypothetical protein
MNEPTYIFENGHVYAMENGRVIASAQDVDTLEEKLAFGDFSQGPAGPPAPGPEAGGAPAPTAMPDPPADIQDDLGMAAQPCPQCGGQNCQDGYCQDCGAQCDDPAAAGPPGMDPGMGMDPGAGAPGMSVTTPNGLQGQVLGKTAGMWGDEVTVRFENGRIVRLPVNDGLKFSTTKTASKTGDPIGDLERRLDVTPDGTAASLAARLKALSSIRTAATNMMPKASFDDQTRLASISAQADYEVKEVKEALAYISDEQANAYRPPTASYEFGKEVVAQETLGGGDASWLDNTVDGMIAEAEATDYEKLMDEGPEMLVAELDAPVLANAGTTREIAARHIRSFTAGANPELRDQYEKTWLARVEEVRRVELANRKTETRKEAAAQEQDVPGLPDDALFL